MTQKVQMAILIDADNLSVKAVEEALTKAAQQGDIRRICAYRDWKHAGEDWNQLVARYAIRQVQQFACAKRKNASDISLTIDAMDYLHKGVRAFGLMSSDSDFTPLALRLRRGGARVFGFGGATTPKALREACDGFHVVGKPKIAPPEMKRQALAAPLKRVHDLLRKSVAETEQDGGWAHLGAVGNKMAALMATFDPKSYGFARMSDLIEASGLFEVRRDTAQQNAVYIRLKPAA